MYICLCNALTDADIRRATETHGARRPAEVFEHCGCRAQCGSCVRTLCGMVRDTLRTDQPAVFAPA
ncbi:MAG TPA: (2Fe-2S)-binding protein [Rhodopila sp.]|nr:(2Fe-2S)-binding protein [Rhodopila sp.]